MKFDLVIKTAPRLEKTDYRFDDISLDQVKIHFEQFISSCDEGWSFHLFPLDDSDNEEDDWSSLEEVINDL